MITRADVGDDGNLATIECQSFAQQATSGRFKNSSIDIGVHQNIAGTAWATAITIVNLTAVDIHTVGVGHAHAQLIGFEKMRRQSHGGCLAVGAGDRNDRNTSVVSVGVHVIDDGFANISTFAKRRTDVHAQTWGRIDFHNATILFF